MMKQVIIVLMLILSVGCPLPETKPKPVEISGLGSLSALKEKELDESQLLKVVKTVSNQRLVN